MKNQKVQTCVPLRNVLFATGTIDKLNKDIKISTNVRYLKS